MHSLEGLPEKGRAFKELVVCYVVWLGSMFYGMGLWISARCMGQVPCFGHDGVQAQVPQHPIDTCRYNTISKC